MSTAYYALFHLLIDEAARMLVSGTNLRRHVARTFLHGEMKRASASFAGGTLPKRLRAISGDSHVSEELKSFATEFVDLQESRHDADYNLDKSFTKDEAQGVIDRVQDAFDSGKTIRKRKESRMYLASLLLWDRWGRIP